MRQLKDWGQADEDTLEEQKHEITDNASEVISQNELNLIEHERKIQEAVFSRIYERHTGIKVGFFMFKLRLKIK